MSDNEKFEQIGRLAEEYGHLKGKLGHVTEKLNRAQMDYQLLGQMPNFQSLRVQDGKLTISVPQYGGQPRNIEGMLNTHELIEALEERQRLSEELAKSAERLRALAPHLL